MGFAKFRDPNEESERLKRHGSELSAFCGSLNPCTGSSSRGGVAGRLASSAGSRVASAAAARKAELGAEAATQTENAQSAALEAVGDEESALPGFYESGVLGNMDKVIQTLDMIVASMELLLNANRQAAAAADEARSPARMLDLTVEGSLAQSSLGASKRSSHALALATSS